MDLRLTKLGKIDFACEVAEKAGTGVTLSAEDLRMVLDLIIERNMLLTTMTTERDDSRAWARRWKRAAKRQRQLNIRCGIVQQQYRDEADLLMNQLAEVTAERDASEARVVELKKQRDEARREVRKAHEIIAEAEAEPPFPLTERV